jgi:FkbM family methyltransferase
MGKIKSKIKNLYNNLVSSFKVKDDKVISISDFKLLVNWKDGGGRAYSERGSFEEISNPLYRLLKNTELAIDVGANYGFISVILANQTLPGKLILIEPNTDLAPYINENMRLNHAKDYELISAICGEEEKSDIIFNVLPNQSQDSRVVGENKDWKPINQKMISLGGLLKREKPANFFIKIDTQGYEFPIFKGMEEVLLQHKDWLIKTEFAPNWLEKQGTDPSDFLRYLTERYEVSEFPKRVLYYTDSINDFFVKPIKSSGANDFVNYVVDLNGSKMGWVDLILRSKSKNS